MFGLRLYRVFERGMTTQVSENASMPVEGSSYFEYLRDFPVGISMEMDLGFVEEEECVFTVTKVAQNQWRGCPFTLEIVSTIELFEHVCGALEGDDFIRVCHGKDPHQVKREMVDRCALLLVCCLRLCVRVRVRTGSLQSPQPRSQQACLVSPLLI